MFAGGAFPCFKVTGIQSAICSRPFACVLTLHQLAQREAQRRGGSSGGGHTYIIDFQPGLNLDQVTKYSLRVSRHFRGFRVVQGCALGFKLVVKTDMLMYE